MEQQGSLFDRDLENFQRLHAEGAIGVGIVAARGKSTQDQMVKVIHECHVNKRVSSHSDLVRFGLRPKCGKDRWSEKPVKVSRPNGQGNLSPTSLDHPPHMGQTACPIGARCRQSVPAASDRDTCNCGKHGEAGMNDDCRKQQEIQNPAYVRVKPKMAGRELLQTLVSEE